MLQRLPIVGVFGRGSRIDAERAQLAREVGALVARLPAHLLTGAGFGVMESAAEGFTSVHPRAGLSIGIVPRRSRGPLDQPNREAEGRAYPNAFVEIAIMTPLPPRAGDWRKSPARNHINIFTAHAAIALPGGHGTSNELDMAAYYHGESILAREDRRTVLVGPPDEFSAGHRALFIHAASADEAERHIRKILAARGFSLGTRPMNERAIS